MALRDFLANGGPGQGENETGIYSPLTLLPSLAELWLWLAAFLCLWKFLGGGPFATTHPLSTACCP